jgi:hypothetical protein
MCCKFYYSVQRWVLSFFYSKEPVVYQSIINNHTEIELISASQYIRKNKLWQNEPARFLNDDEINTIVTEKVEMPWLWIGAKYPFGESDMTQTLNEFVVSGNVITPELLEQAYPFHYSWSILDSATFKLVDFPGNGITIHASRTENTEEKNEEVKTTE